MDSICKLSTLASLEEFSVNLWYLLNLISRSSNEIENFTIEMESFKSLKKLEINLSY
jgi:hypothetical protein